MSEAEHAEHVVTLRFKGPLGEKMADHFFSSWVDGDIAQVWAEALDESDIAEAVEYDNDPETRTLTIEAAEADDEDEGETAKAGDEDEQEDAA